MKHSFIYFLSQLAVLTLFFSCQKAPELILTGPSSIELNADGSSSSITFTANRDWRVSSSDAWVTLSPSSGTASEGPVTVTVRCNANTTYDDRTATVTISMEELSQTVTVRQLANQGVVLPKRVYDLQADSQSIAVEVQANVQYTVSTSVDWIKQIETKALISKTLSFSIEENKTYDTREGKITIIPQGSNEKGEEVIVKQAGAPAPEGSVDLGIVMTREDGSTYHLFWAECNIGASKPEEFGDYYAWGEIETKTIYSDVNYKWANGAFEKITKYCPTDWPNWWDGKGNPDNKSQLDLEDDVAHVKLGGKWRIPSVAEIDCLLKACSWTWASRNGIDGIEVKNNNLRTSIFLPAAGSIVLDHNSGSGSGQYWSSTCQTSYYPIDALGLYFDCDHCNHLQTRRVYGLLIRPVTE